MVMLPKVYSKLPNGVVKFARFIATMHANIGQAAATPGLISGFNVEPCF
jgi:hypothetical protein